MPEAEINRNDVAQPGGDRVGEKANTGNNGITVCLTNNLVLSRYIRSLWIPSIHREGSFSLSVFTEKQREQRRRGHMQIEEDLGGSLRPCPSTPLVRQIASLGSDTRRFVLLFDYTVGSDFCYF